MGRAVGGAGAGCAGAGVLGILVSVAIVVWLGSQGLGGGAGDGGDPPRPTDPASLLGALDPPVVVVADGGAVVAGEPAAVRATGVAPGAATVAICAIDPVIVTGGAVDESSCGPALATVTVGESGVLVAEVAVADRLELADRTVDCRAEACAVVVRPATGGPAGVAALDLTP